MDRTLIIWLFGVVGICLAGLAKLWWDHIKDCRARVAEAAVLRADLNRVIHEIGDHETGIRGGLHELRNQITPMYMDWQRRSRQ